MTERRPASIVPTSRSVRPSAPREELGAREFLAFMLGGEPYALPLAHVREIMRLPNVTEVPRGPADVLGIISVRGTVTTLLDLRRRLKMAEAPISSRTRVLLVDQGDEIMGLMVDRVLQVYRLQEDQVELATVLGADASAYVMGIGRPGEHNETETGVDDTDAGDGEAGSGAQQPVDMLILLDPIALLKRSL